MKVLVFTSLYPNNIWPHHGVFVKERMTRVAKLNECRVKVIAPVPYFPPVKINRRWLFSQIHKKEIVEGVEVYHPRYFILPKLGMAFHGLTMFLAALPLARKLRVAFDFDLIDSHYAYPDGFAALLLGRFFKKPVVVSARGTDINLFTEFPLIRRILRYTLQNAAGVIAVSQSLKKRILQMKIPEEKIAVIPNGVDPSKFYPFPKDEARRQLNLPNKRVILSVGNLTVNKGFDLLIRAFAILLEENPNEDLYLVIVGEGNYRKELEKIVSSGNLSHHVRLAGVVSHNELILWYSVADLFCLLSNREGWPNVLLESLACGTPVLATSVGGIPEIIRSENIGLLTRRTERDIADSILIALKKPWHQDTMVTYARAHSWDRAALSVFDVFKSALNAKIS